jgi:predicted nucleotidyltransferase
MRYGLSEIVIQKVCNIFLHYPSIIQVILYGSRAKGTYKEGSDIDISLVGDIDFDSFATIKTALDDLCLPYHIDLSIFQDIANKELIDHIQRVGIVLCDKNKI